MSVIQRTCNLQPEAAALAVSPASASAPREDRRRQEIGLTCRHVLHRLRKHTDVAPSLGEDPERKSIAVPSALMTTNLSINFTPPSLSAHYYPTPTDNGSMVPTVVKLCVFVENVALEKVPVLAPRRVALQLARPPPMPPPKVVLPEGS